MIFIFKFFEVFDCKKIDKICHFFPDLQNNAQFINATPTRRE